MFFRNVFFTDRGVMCLDIHPSHCYFIVVGFYDGECDIVFSTVFDIFVSFCLLVSFVCTKEEMPNFTQNLMCIFLKLTLFMPIFHYYTPPKTLENLCFSDVFREYRSGILTWKGLTHLLLFLFYALRKQKI